MQLFFHILVGIERIYAQGTHHIKMSRKNHQKVTALQIPPFFSASFFWMAKDLGFSYLNLMTTHQAVAAVGEVEDMVDQMEKHVLCH